LEPGRDEQPDPKERDKRHEPQERDVVVADVKKRPLEEGEIHGFSLNDPDHSATGNRTPTGAGSELKQKRRG
jgi:hypothetical protein